MHHYQAHDNESNVKSSTDENKGTIVLPKNFDLENKNTEIKYHYYTIAWWTFLLERIIRFQEICYI